MHISVDRPLLLGSASPRRYDLLRGLGLPLVVVPAGVDEARRPAEPPEAFLERIVLDKLESAVARGAERFTSAALVADTIVVLEGDVLGKPEDARDARRLLGRIAGREHVVMTRYAILAAAERAAPVARTVSTRVTIKRASEAELDRYAESGEGLDKAGAYAAQGIGAFLIERIDGSYSNVVGLPLCEAVDDLSRLGLLGPFP
jgi:septum formation protein